MTWLRQTKRRARAWRFKARARAWMLVLLVVFSSSEFVLRNPGMFALAQTQQHDQHQMSTADRRAPDQNPAHHDHQQCQLCMAPALALPPTDWAQLGKTRLELVGIVQPPELLLVAFEHEGFVSSRAPPA